MMRAPVTREVTVIITVVRSEYMTRLSMSRPRRSVPRGWVMLGLSLTEERSWSLYPWGATSGANTPEPYMMTMMARQVMDSFLRDRRRTERYK